MPNQQARILAATELQRHKKQELATLARATQTNFNHEPERLMAIASQKQLINTQDILLTRVSQLANIQAQATAQSTLQERLTSAHSLNTHKHKHQAAIARSIPKTDDPDTAQYWHNPFSKLSNPISNKSLVSK